MHYKYILSLSTVPWYSFILVPCLSQYACPPDKLLRASCWYDIQYVFCINITILVCTI